MAVVTEWLNLIVRWVHVIAAIMWVGDSFLFMWLDSHLEKPTKPREGTVVGELWMTHSGGFYEVVKRKSLDALPPQLYWFKWESYTTWLSGFCLLVIVYYLGGASFLVDPQVSSLTPGQAVHVSFLLLPLGYGLYELLWLTPLARDQRAFGAVGFACIVALAYATTHLFSGRAAFLQVGATLGTVMAANVFFRIIPAQRHMIAATQAGTPVDTSYGLRAKGRSVHNHYLTLPVLFTMLSNHFPSTHGHPQAWLVLACLFVFGASLKYVMNFRRQSEAAVVIALGTSLAAFGYLTAPSLGPLPGLERYAEAKPVSFATVEALVQTRCVSCHAAKPTSSMFAAPPLGVMLEKPEQLKRHADRMYLLAVATKTMPLGNITGMTEDERALLGAWVAQGASTTAAGTVALPATSAPPSTLAGANADGGATLFEARCALCHGTRGLGDGPAAAGLPVKPRAFSDASWQASVTDAQLAAVITGGGASIGKSPLMPAQADLANQPERLAELVAAIRAFAAAGAEAADGGRQ